MCGNSGGQGGPGSCTTPGYLLKTDFDVWYPLTFLADGSIAPFHPLPSFTLDLP